MPLLEILDLDTDYKKSNEFGQIKDEKINFSTMKSSSFQIKFQNILLEEPSYVGLITYPLTFTIRQGQRVLIYQTDDQSRNLLLYSFTRNLPMLTEPQFFNEKDDTITIGDEDIRQIQPRKLYNMIGVILSINFYFSGSIKENISLEGDIDQKEAGEYINLLGLNMDLGDFINQGLETQLNFEANQLNPSITKKIALLRILLHKPKIIIIKDTTSFIQSISIIQMIETHYPFKPTIIKINNSIESSFDIERIIYMENLQVKEDGLRKNFVQNKNSELGQMLKDVNLEGYLYTHRAQSSIGKKKKHSLFVGIAPFKGKRQSQ